jgi:hypothetical protein
MTEYRIRWRRASWSPTTQSKTRRLARAADLQKFVAKLAAYDPRDLLTYDVHVREVGPWREVD